MTDYGAPDAPSEPTPEYTGTLVNLLDATPANLTELFAIRPPEPQFDDDRETVAPGEEHCGGTPGAAHC